MKYKPENPSCFRRITASVRRADNLVCWLAGLSSSASGDGKATQSRRLENMRHEAAAENSGFRNKQNTLILFACLSVALMVSQTIGLVAANPPHLLNDPVDVSGDFHNFANLYYLADKLASFDPATGRGEITYQRAEYFSRLAFNNML